MNTEPVDGIDVEPLSACIRLLPWDTRSWTPEQRQRWVTALSAMIDVLFEASAFPTACPTCVSTDPAKRLKVTMDSGFTFEPCPNDWHTNSSPAAPTKEGKPQP